MNILKEIIKNQLIRIPFVRRRAQDNHVTGINQNSNEVKKLLEFYEQHISFYNDDVLEIGPGQTYQVAEEISKKSKSISLLDIDKYIEDEIVRDLNIDYKIYDGNKMPFSDESFEKIVSYTVYEHIRNPELTVSETYRVLKKGGQMLHFIDLGDHFSYGVDERLLFNCLRYSKNIWNLMTWNRSNYVNRLRASEWVKLHEKNGFKVLFVETRTSELIKNEFNLGNLDYLSKISEEDRFASNIIIKLEK